MTHQSPILAEPDEPLDSADAMERRLRWIGATRYHSLVAAPETVPPCLKVNAWTEDGTIMGLRHESLPIHGVQVHPESIETEAGHQLLRNFLALAKAGGTA